MLPIFPRITTSQGQGRHGHHPTTATAPLVAFLVLVAAVFAVCLFSAAARRLFSLILGASSSTAVSSAPLPPHRRLGRRGGGMDPAEVGPLPVRAYDDGGAEGHSVCAVCLGELQAKESVKAIPECGHVFHPPYIDRWLLAGRASCPLCRCSAAADTALKPAQPQQQHETPASAA